MIDLARSADFILGSIAVRPSSRELVGDAGVVMVEPKVMQVLVALSQAGGRVVSRDELIQGCWDGRIVGDDAINRVIGKLRRVAEDACGGAFRIETVARTGHRLICGLPAAPAAVTDTVLARRPRRSSWPALMIASTLVAILLGLSLYGHRHGTVAAVVKHSLPPAVTDLETRGLSSMFENTPEQTAEGVDYLRQAAVLAPRAAPVWGSLAMSYVLSLGWAPPADRAAIVARVQSAAGRGLTLDPRESRSAAALVSLQPTFGQWATKDAALAAAEARAYPDSGPLAFQRVQFLIATGQERAALAAIRPIVAASPLIPWIRATYVNLLAANGRLEDADKAAEEAGKIWPRDRLIWFTRFDLAMFNGQPGRALAIAADRQGWPKQTGAEEIELAMRTAKVMQVRGDETAPLLRTLMAAAPHGQAESERAIRAAAALGRPDLALIVARSLLTDRPIASPRRTVLSTIGLPADADPPTTVLFLPPGSLLARQPGFLDLMRDVGFVAYWHHARPPDFCADEPSRTPCRRAGLSR